MDGPGIPLKKYGQGTVSSFLISHKQKEEGKMKKIICLVVVILMIAAVAYAAKKVVITPKNVASLKGTWTGVMSFGVFAGGSMTSPCTLEILNDAAPVKAKLTLSNVPDEVARQFGSGQAGPRSAESDDGTITSSGTVLWTGPEKNFFEITLMDNKKLSGWAYFRGMRCEGTLSKK